MELKSLFYLKNLNRFSYIFLLFFTLNVSAQDTSWPGLNLGALSCPSTTSQSGSTTGAAINCGNSSAGDHIYQFTTTVACDVVLSLCTGTSFDSQIWLYDFSTGDCNSTSIASNDDNCSLQSQITQAGLAAGTYVVVVEGYSTNEGSYQLDITLSNCQNNPDVPCDATNLTVECAANYSTYTNSGFTDSGEGNPGCGNYSGGDVWYTFTAPASGEATIFTQANGLTDMAMALYSEGAMGCSSLSQLTCSDGGSGMPSITQTGLTSGNTYYVRIWDENNNQTGTFDIAVTDPTQLYCLNGDAVEFTPTGHTASDYCVQLTDAINNQSGCAWSNSPFDLNNDFDVEFNVYLGNNDGGADGMAFVIQNSGGGAQSSCGSSGGGVGAEGITPSLIVEFDTWQNGAGEAVNLPWEPAYDHISVETDGTLIHDGFGNNAPACGPVQASATSADIEDGSEHAVRITWSATTQNLDIYFDGSLRLSCTIDLVTVLGTTTPTWGFSASTGGFNNEQYFCPGTLPLVLAVDLLDFSATCGNGGNIVNWNINEHSGQEFIIQKSDNGRDFIDVAQINDHENTNFEWTDTKGGNSYYRIKQKNQIGKDIYSETIKTNCKESTYNAMKSWTSQNQINVQIDKKYLGSTLKVVDLRGREIDSKKTNLDNLYYSFNLEEAKGMYLIQLTTENGMIITDKIIF